MIYLDNGATSLHKPPRVRRAVLETLAHCANPGRGGYPAAMEAEKTLFCCREKAGAFFRCEPEQVIFTANCTQGLNMAIRTLVRPGSRVVITGFEHNAVLRPLHALGAQVYVAGRRLFDWADTLEHWEAALRRGMDAAVFTHVSNVFGYILPVAEMAGLCRQYAVPFILDAAQSAGSLPVDMEALGADFIAMPGHKGLLGPQGTGLLLCGRLPQPLIFGGTGSESASRGMPAYLPDRMEPGTANVPGIAGLSAGLDYLRQTGIGNIFRRAHGAAMEAVKDLQELGFSAFAGAHQAATVSFLTGQDCEAAARQLGSRGIAVRAGLHCAPLAHESAGTLEQGTVRLSFGHDACPAQNRALRRALAEIIPAAE